MKNTQTLWDLLILLLIMCAGVASIKFLATNNQDKFDYRFPDKLLEAGAPTLDNDGRTDPNLESPTLKNYWDFYLSPAEVYGIMYVQDYTCPMIVDASMRLKVAGQIYILDNNYEANKRTNIRQVIRDIALEDLNVYPDTKYYFNWNSAEKCWELQYKKWEYNDTSNRWEETR